MEIIWAVYQGCVAVPATVQEVARFAEMASAPGNRYVGLFCSGSEIVEVHQTPSGVPRLRHR